MSARGAVVLEKTPRWLGWLGIHRVRFDLEGFGSTWIPTNREQWRAVEIGDRVSIEVEFHGVPP